MSKKDIESASLNAEASDEQICSERGCYRSLRGWHPDKNKTAAQINSQPSHLSSGNTEGGEHE